MSKDDSDGASPTLPTVMIAAADDSFRSFLEYTLQNKGVRTVGVRDAHVVIDRLHQEVPDILLLESRLPGVDVPALCARLRLNRRTRSMSILVLAAEGDELTEQQVLESGADQYLGRPLSPEHLMASLGAALSATNPGAERRHRELLTFVDLELDVARYQVRRNGRIIHLAPTEFRLLRHLMKNPRRVHSRDELQNAAWPRPVHLGPRTIDVHIGRLRAALNEAGGQDLIRTVRSVGYALSD